MGPDLTAQAIQLLLEKGWPILPSTGAHKKPCIKWKQFQTQLPTVEQLRGWGQSLRPTRWGLVTGSFARVVVIDFDGDAGRTLMEQWNINPHVRTGSGGFHWYLQHPGWPVPTLNAKSSKHAWPWPGVDIRGDGGFAVLLGRNKNGPYVQLRDLDPERFDVLPEELRTFLHNRGLKQDAIPTRDPLNHQPTIVSGSRVALEPLTYSALDIASRNGRNNAGFWLACQLRDNGYAFVDAEAGMRDYQSRVFPTNTKGQREPYEESEMMASLRQAYSQTARDPWERPSPRSQVGSASPETASYEQGQRGEKGFSSQNFSSLRGAAAEGNIADPALNLGLYVGHRGEPLVGHVSEPVSRSRYARIPLEVLFDSRLTARAVRVYEVLASACWHGSEVEIGKRRIAAQIKMAERLVLESLIELEVAGHIERLLRQRGQRGRYRLFSPLFCEKGVPASKRLLERSGIAPRS